MTEVRARVILQERDKYRVKCELGEKLAEVSGKYRYETSTVSDFPAVGDYVTVNWPEDGSNAVITALFPRKSSFIRKAAGLARQEQVVAANIDYVFLCMSMNNDFNLRRLERYLSIAWDSGATPVVLLTKKDLAEDFARMRCDVEAIAMGAEILAVSSLNDDYACVYDYLKPGRTVAFIGSSGVGKSTLINKLLGADKIETQGLRNDDKGRHTTTHRELIELAGGAFVIDTPGMRELGMWDNEEGIDAAFADIEALSLRCRFSDCSHNGEPGCAILSAIGSGVLPQERWDSYRKLKAENAYAADGSSYLAAKKEKFKNIAIQNRNSKKGR